MMTEPAMEYIYLCALELTSIEEPEGLPDRFKELLGELRRSVQSRIEPHD